MTETTGYSSPTLLYTRGIPELLRFELVSVLVSFMSTEPKLESSDLSLN